MTTEVMYTDYGLFPHPFLVSYNPSETDLYMFLVYIERKYLNTQKEKNKAKLNTQTTKKKQPYYNSNKKIQMPPINKQIQANP